MEPIGMETIGAIIAATVPLIILLWVWVVGRELDRQSNRLRAIQNTLEELRGRKELNRQTNQQLDRQTNQLRELQTTLEELRGRKELDRQSNQLREVQATLEELRAWLALVEKQRQEEADPAPLTHSRFRRWQRAARRV
jgi:DNA repair exonuclease SbcCD ATPase subunit